MRLKMLPSWTLCALALTAMLGACAPAAPPDTSAEDIAAINGLRDAWQAAFNAGDAAELASLYTDDAVVMNQGAPTASGRAAIQAHFEGMFSAMTTQMELRPEATEVDGALGVDSGTYTGTVTPKAGEDAMAEGDTAAEEEAEAESATMTEEGRYVVVVKKDAEGEWKVAREMGNTSAAPVEPAESE